MHEKLSVIVPVYNEEAVVEELHSRLVSVCETRVHWSDFEIIFVDDGSTDETGNRCSQLAPLTVITFRKNFGQTSALDAGIKHASGDVIVLMDGDLQNVPEDIPKLVEKLSEGYDVVSGWRKDRKDPFSKRFFSRGAHVLRSFFVKDEIHDSGCTLKAYRAECFEDLDLYGEMHRFIPALLSWKGFRVTELPVQHQPRTTGATKYNWKRMVKGLLDVVGLWFWRKYSNRPLHLFGGAGAIIGGVGVVLAIALVVMRLLELVSLGDRVWTLVSFLLIITGLQLFIAGLLADILVKNYFKTQKQMPYAVRSIAKDGVLQKQEATV